MDRVNLSSIVSEEDLRLLGPILANLSRQVAQQHKKHCPVYKASLVDKATQTGPYVEHLKPAICANSTAKKRTMKSAKPRESESGVSTTYQERPKKMAKQG